MKVAMWLVASFPPKAKSYMPIVHLNFHWFKFCLLFPKLNYCA